MIKIKLADNTTRNIPDDYKVKHINSTTYLNQDGKKCKYVKVKNGRDRPEKMVPSNEDDPVFRFLQDLGSMQFDLDTIQGIKEYLAVFTLMSPLDNYNYINQSTVIQSAHRLQEAVDVMQFDDRLKAIENKLLLIRDRISDPDLQADVDATGIHIFSPEKNGGG